MVFDLLLFSLCLFRPHCLTHTRGCHLWRLKFRSVLSLKYVYHPLSLTSILWVRFFSRPSYADRKWKKTWRNTFSLLYLRKSLQWNEILKYGRNTFQPVWLNTITATLPSKLTCLVLLLIHSFECSSINPIKDFHQITLFFCFTLTLSVPANRSSDSLSQLTAVPPTLLQQSKRLWFAWIIVWILS